MLNKADIARLIPHAGAMCLLDGVVRRDSAQIRCVSRTHRDMENPLRAAGTPALTASRPESVMRVALASPGTKLMSRVAKTWPVACGAITRAMPKLALIG